MGLPYDSLLVRVVSFLLNSVSGNLKRVYDIVNRLAYISEDVEIFFTLTASPLNPSHQKDYVNKHIKHKLKYLALMLFMCLLFTKKNLEHIDFFNALVLFISF